MRAVKKELTGKLKVANKKLSSKKANQVFLTSTFQD